MILNESDAEEKTSYDLFSFKNTKYLAYRFNDFQNSIGGPLIKIIHSLVTDNYLAAEEIQNQNWQYSIERVIEVCKSKKVGSTTKPTEEFLITIVENVTLTERVYETLYKTVTRNFYSTMSILSVDEQKQIKEDLLSKNFWWKDSLEDLDSWIAFYYHLEDSLDRKNSLTFQFFKKTEMSLSPADLYKKFAETDAKALVSLHALAALNIYLGENRIAAENAFGNS